MIHLLLKEKKHCPTWLDLISAFQKQNFVSVGEWKRHNSAKDKPNDVAMLSKSSKRVGRKDKQAFTLFEKVSCNLSSIKLLINTRVACRSLSTLPHLHKTKGTRFPCHRLPFERQAFPQWDDLGPLGLTWGQSLSTQLKRSAAQSLQKKLQINQLLPLDFISA